MDHRGAAVIHSAPEVTWCINPLLLVTAMTAQRNRPVFHASSAREESLFGKRMNDRPPRLSAAGDSKEKQILTET